MIRFLSRVNKLTLKPVLVIILSAISIFFYYGFQVKKSKDYLTAISNAKNAIKKTGINYWTAPDINAIADENQKKRVEYGKELIAHTSKYLGPKGIVLKNSNGLNCQNCHLQAGTAVFGNNYSSVASLYPKFRARSGTIENVYKRVNDCFERSLNGKALDTTSEEMRAIVAYIYFLGNNVKKGTKAEGSGLKAFSLLRTCGRSGKRRKGLHFKMPELPPAKWRRGT